MVHLNADKIGVCIIWAGIYGVPTITKVMSIPNRVLSNYWCSYRECLLLGLQGKLKFNLSLPSLIFNFM